MIASYQGMSVRTVLISAAIMGGMALPNSRPASVPGTLAIRSRWPQGGNTQGPDECEIQGG